MKHLQPLLFSCLLMITSVQEKAPTIDIKPGASIYVVAIKSNNQAADLTAERKAKEEFSKSKTFKLATSLANADLVYFMLTEYEYNQTGVFGISTGSEDLKNIAVFVLKPDDYKAHKQSLDELREAAIWQQAKSTGPMRGSGQLSKLVKAFQEQAIKKK
jgi:hypothetical protein